MRRPVEATALISSGRDKILTIKNLELGNPGHNHWFLSLDKINKSKSNTTLKNTTVSPATSILQKKETGSKKGHSTTNGLCFKRSLTESSINKTGQLGIGFLLFCFCLYATPFLMLFFGNAFVQALAMLGLFLIFLDFTFIRTLSPFMIAIREGVAIAPWWIQGLQNRNIVIERTNTEYETSFFGKRTLNKLKFRLYSYEENCPDCLQTYRLKLENHPYYSQTSIYAVCADRPSKHKYEFDHLIFEESNDGK